MKTKILLIATAACLFGATVSLAQTVPSYVPTNGLVGWWPFNGNASDESGNGNNGTVNGATLTTDRFGSQNCAFFFDGLTAHITGSLSNFTNTSSSTVSAWVKYDGDAGGQPYDFYFQYGNYGNHVFAYAYNYNNQNLDLYSQCFANPYTSVNISNTWHHLVVVDSFSQTTIFLDGNILTSFSWGSGSNCYQGSNQFYIGGGADNQFTTGSLDDIGIWNRALTQQEITALYQSNNCNLPGYVPSNGLVGWWPFCGNANDLSGNGNNGIVYGATLTSDRFGDSNSAYSFDGNADYIDCGNSNSVNITGDITISAWVNANNFNTDHGIVSKSGLYDFITNAPLSQPPLDKLRFTVGVVPFLFSNPIQSNQWLHVVAVNNNSSGKYIYLNGALFASDNQVGVVNPSNTYNLFLGAHQPFSVNNWSWDGLLDDIGIWNRVLTQQEITNLYNGTASGMSDENSWSNLSVYPNPVQDQLFVDLGGMDVSQVQKIQLLNTQGQVVATRFVDEMKTVGFDAQYMSAGLYLVRIQLADGGSVSRMVVVNK